MGLYGDTGYSGSDSNVERVGAGGKQCMFTAVFTTAGAGAPTVDAAKTRGVVSIVKGGTGIHAITLPFKMRNIHVQTSQSGTTAQLVQANAVEGTNVVTVTTVTAGGSTAADSTGIIAQVGIWGTAL